MSAHDHMLELWVFFGSIRHLLSSHKTYSGTTQLLSQLVHLCPICSAKHKALVVVIKCCWAFSIIDVWETSTHCVECNTPEGEVWFRIHCASVALEIASLCICDDTQ